MKMLRKIGSLAFVAGLFTAVFVGVPWHIVTSTDPVIPWWLRAAVFAILGGILLVLISLATEQKRATADDFADDAAPDDNGMIVQTQAVVPGHEIAETIGIVQGHTVFAIWLGNDISALMRLILGGELTEYTDMMGRARRVATNRMVAQAKACGADAVVNVWYMTTSVVGTASEIMVYGTAVKLAE